MNVFAVIAYRYDSGVHCTICAEVKFGLDYNLEVVGVDSKGFEVKPIYMGQTIDSHCCKSCGREFKETQLLTTLIK